ncbi:MAG TPA: serine hydrolase domain-containing protein [Vicinamibacterales bacterium]|nr:serine hydrolase domain-containing protein [Vicinamibacterales bacterium]
MSRFADVQTILDDAVRDGATPGAVLEVGRADGVVWSATAGRLSYDPESPAVSEDTIYDLASLTKVIATTSIAMRLVEARRLRLSERVGAFVRAWRGVDREIVTVRDLLEHCGGLAGWAPLYLNHSGRAAFESAIAAEPLAYPPWTKSVYSDLGFILLGFVLEDSGGAPLDVQFASLSLSGIVFQPDASLKPRIAPTRRDGWRGRLLVGEVDDNNARALGGVAGHAGLFGTAAAVGAFGRLVLRTFAQETELGRPETLRRFVTRSTVPRSSRALGWDTMLPTSSCGTLLSPRAIGHTGFTGTSLWIDPERDLYVVLLTNRVHPTPENEALPRLRPAIHDAVVRAMT